MIPVPTPYGCLFLVLAVLSLAVAFVNVGLATALAAVALCSILGASFILSFFSLFGIRVRRERSGEGTCMESVSLPVTVENTLPFPRQAFVLKESCAFVPDGRVVTAVPPLSARRSVTLPRTMRAVHRGHYNLRKLTISVGDPAGLFRKSKSFRFPGEITIAPRLFPLSSLPLRQHSPILSNMDGRPLGHAGNGFEFFGVRAYRPGDEVRFIHWRATANQGKLMVKEHEANTVDRIVMVLDTCGKEIGNDAHENNFEYLISAVASIVDYLSRVYCHLTFITEYVPAETILLTGDAAGIKNKIFSVLTDLKPSDVPISALVNQSLESIQEGCILYVFSMSQSSELLDELELLKERYVQVRFLLAPKANFPRVHPEERRYVRPNLVAVDENRLVRPRLIQFDTKLQDILR